MANHINSASQFQDYEDLSSRAQGFNLPAGAKKLCQPDCMAIECSIDTFPGRRMEGWTEILIIVITQSSSTGARLGLANYHIRLYQKL